MRYLRDVSRDEVASELLAAEYESKRVGGSVRSAMEKLGAEERIVTRPDLENEDECLLRLRVLGEVGRLPAFFALSESEINWALFEYTSEDLVRTYLSEEDEWKRLSLNTRLPMGVAETLRRGEEESSLVPEIESAAEHIREGKTFRPVVLLKYARLLCTVDGNLRLSAYALAPESMAGAACYVGRCASAETFAEWLGELPR